MIRKDGRKVRLGKLIREHRNESGLSQVMLAKAIGVTQAYVAKLERADTSIPTNDMLSKLAHALQLTNEKAQNLHALASAIRGGTTGLKLRLPANPVAVDPDSYEDIIAQEFIRLWPELSVQEKRAIWRILENHVNPKKRRVKPKSSL